MAWTFVESSSSSLTTANKTQTAHRIARLILVQAHLCSAPQPQAPTSATLARRPACCTPAVPETGLGSPATTPVRFSRATRLHRQPHQTKAECMSQAAVASNNPTGTPDARGPERIQVRRQIHLRIHPFCTQERRPTRFFADGRQAAYPLRCSDFLRHQNSKPADRRQRVHRTTQYNTNTRTLHRTPHARPHAFLSASRAPHLAPTHPHALPHCFAEITSDTDPSCAPPYHISCEALCLLYISTGPRPYLYTSQIFLPPLQIYQPIPRNFHTTLLRLSAASKLSTYRPAKPRSPDDALYHRHTHTSPHSTRTPKRAFVDLTRAAPCPDAPPCSSTLSCRNYFWH